MVLGWHWDGIGIVFAWRWRGVGMLWYGFVLLLYGIVLVSVCYLYGIGMGAVGCVLEWYFARPIRRSVGVAWGWCGICVVFAWYSRGMRMAQYRYRAGLVCHWYETIKTQ